MKKKLLSFLLIGAMVLSNATMAFATEEVPVDGESGVVTEDETTPEDEIAPISEDDIMPIAEPEDGKVSGTKAVEDFKAGTATIIDVRAFNIQADNGYIGGTLRLPLFTNDGSNHIDGADFTDPLSVAFLEATKNLSGNIYILCNSGASGAAKATALLKENGIVENVYTIRGGASNDPAKGSDGAINKAFNKTGNPSVAGAKIASSVDDGKIIILDVRAKVRYDAGHLKLSKSLPLFTVDPSDPKKNIPVGEPYTDELSQAFVAAAKANKEAWAGKPIYVLCNSGATGAYNATKLLVEKAGYSLDNVYTIVGGANPEKGDGQIPALLTYVSGTQAVSVIGNSDYIILDVRAAERNAAGTLPGAVSLPLFTADGDKNIPVEAPYEDALSQAFLTYVRNNKATLSAKTIYILCNSGATGAFNAKTLLAQEGITANVFTIEGGASENKNGSDGAVYAFINKKSETPSTGTGTATGSTSNVPKTADLNTTMPYVLAMGVALLAVVAAFRKRFAK